MSAEDYIAWAEHMGLSGLKAAAALGVNKNTENKYRRQGTPKYIGLACAALAFGLPQWRVDEGNTD